MATVSAAVSERSRKMQTAVLQRLQEPGRAVAIASSLGISESTISRIKNDHLATLCDVLAHAGFKIVPTEMRCYEANQIDALLTFAKAHLEKVESSEALSWE